MNKLIVTTAILTIAMFASGALAISGGSSTLNEQVVAEQASCGIAFAGPTYTASLDFGSHLNNAAWTSDGSDHIDLYNIGNVPTTSLAVYGSTDGGGSVYWWGATTGENQNIATSVYDTYTGWFTLLGSGSPTPIFGGVIPANNGIVTPYFQVSVPAGQPADTYTQAITFSGGC